MQQCSKIHDHPALATVSPVLGWMWILQQPVLSSVRWLLEWAPNTGGFVTYLDSSINKIELVFDIQPWFPKN
jgi:hypothetical protein